MGKLFSYDGGILRIINKIVDCVILSVLWVLFSLPLFTIGASTTALYYTINKVIIHDRSHVWREFWGSFKANFKQAVLAWLPIMVVYYMMITSAIIAFLQGTQGGDNAQMWYILLGMYAVVAIFFTMWVGHVFPHIARFENTTMQIYKNCLMLTIRHVLKSLGLLAVFIICVVAVVGFFWVLIFIAPAAYMLVANYLLEPVYKRYMSEEDLEAEEERNRVYYN